MLQTGGSLLKRILASFCLIALILVGCTSQRGELSKLAGFEIPPSTIISVDRHGGFHGDGASYVSVILPDSFRSQADAVFTGTEGWRTFPLSTPVAAALYGDETHSALFEIHEDIPVPPVVTSGYWRFIDRHRESTNPYDDMDLYNRASYNFTVILYDSTANTLYFYTLDT